jgi:hypothetical protein
MTRNPFVVSLGGLLLALCGPGTAPAGQKNDPFAGIWQYIDPSTKKVVTTVLVAPGGRCKEFGSHPVLSNPNYCKFEEGLLSWCRVAAGKKEVPLLTGKVKWNQPSSFNFELVGGVLLQQPDHIYHRKKGVQWEFTRRLAPVADGNEQRDALVGQWECYDADNPKQLLMTIGLTRDGKCQELGDKKTTANCYSFDGGMLSFESIGKGPDQTLWSGILDWDGKNTFRLEVVGAGRVWLTIGMKLVCKRQ